MSELSGRAGRDAAGEMSNGEGAEKLSARDARRPLETARTRLLVAGAIFALCFVILGGRLVQLSLLGAGPLERARNRELERLAELGVLGPVARIVHATKSPLGLPPIPEVAAASRRILPDVLRVLDAGLADGRPFFGGDRPIVADCTLQAALQFARFAEIDLELPERVARWDRNYREREVARSVLVV